MQWQYTPYLIPLLVSAALTGFLAVFVWRRRPMPGATAYAVLMFFISVWSLGYALELSCVDMSAAIFGTKIEYIGITGAPLAWLASALDYGGERKRLAPRTLLLLGIIPFITLVLAWTNEFHHLVWSDITQVTSGSFYMLDFEYGVWLWTYTAYTYLMLLAGAWQFVLMLFHAPRLYRGQAIVVLLGVLAPFVGNALYAFGLGPLPNLELTPFAFSLSGLAMTWGLFRYRLLDIVPVARHALIEDMSDGMIVLDARNRIVDINPAAREFMACGDADVVGKPAHEGLADYMDLLEQHLDLQSARTITIQGRHHPRRDYELRLSPLRDQRGYVASRVIAIRDITERKQAEEALRRRDAILGAVSFAAERLLLVGPRQDVIQEVLEKLGKATEASRVYVFKNHSDEQGTLVTSQRHEWVVAGIEPQIDNAELQNFPWEGFPRWREALGQGNLIAGHVRDFPQEERRVLQLQGILSLVEVPIFVGSQWWGFVGFDECLREREWSSAEMEALRTAASTLGAAIYRTQTEEAARESEGQYRMLFDSMLDGFALHEMIYDAEGHPIDYRFLDINPAFERMTGLSRDVIGKTVLEVLPGTESYWIEAYGRVTGTGESVRIEEYSAEIGKWFSVLAFSPAENQFATIVQDVTEHRRLEEQLRQAVKMEAVGRLAGGVAHDFNNLLTVINGYSRMILDEWDQEPPSQSDIEEISLAGERAATLTRQLLAFSRRQVMRMDVLSLNEIIEGMNKMLGRLIGEDIKLELKLAEDLWNVRADAGQVEQVVVNLAVNARDAMATGGTLTVETANVEMDESFVTAHAGAEAGRYAMIAIADTGTGMTAEVKEHLFEPFFTTKETGKGTGLGLSTVYGIIKQSNGFIYVDTKVGKGTTFHIYLPRVQARIGAESFEVAVVPPTEGTETILVVEDEPGVRALAARMLRRLGYEVLEAGSGAEALDIQRARAMPVDLVLADVVMPEMSGREIAEQLQEMCGEIRVLYMSGYSDEVLDQHGALAADIHVIQKPFNLQDLASAVRSVLDKRGN